jgi:hypothetical protein
MDDGSQAPAQGKDASALAAAAAILRPLADLLLAHGVQYGAMAELLKQQLVEAARRKLPGGAEARSVSRISVATGIHRKEVKRLVSSASPARIEAGRSAASQVFTRWLTDRRFLDAAGKPLPLSRQPARVGGGAEAGAPAASFDALARSVSSDVHPRSILDELLRLRLVETDDDFVRVAAGSFVPASEHREMLRFLADNVGDHLSAAVANVEGSGARNLEQAMFVDGLSELSAGVVDRLAREQWQRMFRDLVPELERLMREDREAGRIRDRRTRIGMYNYAGPSRPEGGADGRPSDPRGDGRRGGDEAG